MRVRAIAISSPRRSRSCRQTLQSPLIAISLSRDRTVDRDLAFARLHRIEIAIDGAISRSVDREISYVGERGRSEIAIDASRDRAVDRDLDPEIFLKCNQTPWKHFPFPEISISGKYVFSGKRFTATKHSLNDFWAQLAGVNCIFFQKDKDRKSVV